MGDLCCLIGGLDVHSSAPYQIGELCLKGHGKHHHAHESPSAKPLETLHFQDRTEYHLLSKAADQSLL